MREFIGGSMAVSKSFNFCRPDVIAAYPITPQTHIVEFLAKMVADGDPIEVGAVGDNPERTISKKR